MYFVWQVFIRYIFCNFFLFSVCDFSFHCLYILSFTKQKLFMLMKSSLSVIFFYSVVSKKSLPYPRSSWCSLMLLSRNFNSLYFTLRSVIHIGLIFVKGVVYGLCLESVFFACGCPVVPAPLLKMLFTPLYCFFLFVEDQLAVFLWIYFSILCSLPLFCLSILLPLPSYLDYCTFIVSLEVRWCQSSSF